MNALVKSIMSTQAGAGLAVLRITTGLTFMAHGSQKLFGLFSGPGLQGTAQWLESLGVTPGYLMATLAGSAEFFGGLALVLGLLVRLASIPLIVAMLVAVFSVHIANGFFITSGGYEYAFTLIMISVAVLISGAGPFSLDRKLSS
ncbi:DoxX family protein [Pseudomonas panipatensis]|jgi:putative oxidoreductase|uniref:Putative oxidoreductase n=1 Tax=Pseudomonas panipatensis TaxID=428992 RepID=A0A1G8CM28_9PSED|nr:DoxX family protein [Pseudomonas panipatensis]SDH46389.1 putative oxidoreductase [Pseudomonas panipatensis]SMP64314.1 putative oxidoreductase [Pseudomonas panipatensis]